MSISNKSILLIDNDPIWLEFSKAALKNNGYQMYSASNLQSVETLLVEDPQFSIDLTFVDANVLKNDSALIEYLLKTENIQTSAIVVLFAIDLDSKQMRNLFKLGVFDCVSKPFDELLLTSLIEQVLADYYASMPQPEPVSAKLTVTGHTQIMLVDNDEDWCRNLQEPLAPSGYSIEIKRDLNSALEEVNEKQIDVVVLNVRLGNNSDSIPKLWFTLLKQIRSKNIEVIVVTSESYPPDVNIYALLNSFYKEYKVENCFIKEKFDKAEYRNSVLKAVWKKMNPPRLLENYKSDLIRLLAQQSQWGGQVRERIGLLLLVGLPSHFVRMLELEGDPDSSAAIIVTHLAELGYMDAVPNYTPLGLLVKYLYKNSIDIPSRRLCANILLECHLVKDEVLLHEAMAYLAQP